MKKGIKNPSLSNKALGTAVRHAFPAVIRCKIGAVHYYCGVKLISNGVGTTSFCKSAIDVQIPEAHQIKNEASSNCLQTKNANSKLVQQTISKHTTMTYIYRGSTGGCQQHRKHDITSIHISLSESQAPDEDPILGEGTFAKCILGTYKGIQVVVKYFKGRPSWKTVYNEANIMLKIPSHPGIPMFNDLFTLDYPYLLVTNFHQYSGKSITYSDFLKHSKKTQNNALYHLLSILLDAIMHLHQSGILHNDIKGNNVLVEKSNRQKRCILIDFGKACTLQESKVVYISLTKNLFPVHKMYMSACS